MVHIFVSAWDIFIYVPFKQTAKDAPSAVDELKAKKAETAGLLKLLQAYKDLGDSKGEVKQEADDLHATIDRSLTFNDLFRSLTSSSTTPKRSRTLRQQCLTSGL